ncbi:Stress-induced-phosphoprotein 1 [Giardia muris]|uniref:Stress-induced-phosphoprotein 1 n=1 Tax=Giardia muris TaxID=5742 RepID=A0A4Z1SSB4_GIAMU|nr:Stress-induced-phosphoprotein 1 [Giardia muris]|eukprot:TNJ28786.1 Stress-induced-phosphoprotein 1 [Giardia muris]
MSAEDLKNQGNAAVKEDRLADAVDLYTQAIGLDGANPVYYSNRASVYHRLGDYDAALADADRCLAISATFGKGYVRKADALDALGRLDEARAVLEEGIERCGDSEPLLRTRLDSLNSRGMGGLGANLFGPDAEAKLRANPKTAKYLEEDPNLLQTLKAVSANPQLMMSMAGSNPKLMECMLVTMGLDPDMLKNIPQGPGMGAPSDYRPPPPPPPPKEEPKKVLTPEEEKGQCLKDEGNELFKEKKYEEAIAKYEEAFEVHKSIVYLNNISTALLKLGRIDDAEAKALEAYQYGKENPGTSTFEEMGKALAKAASAQYARKDYEKAIRTLKDAMLEHRSKQTLALLTKVEDEYETYCRERAYDPQVAERAKNEGNEAFRAGDFDKAVELYTKGLKALPLDPDRDYRDDNERFVQNRTLLISLLNNRANAYFKLGQMNLSYEDVDHVVTRLRDARNVKALTRKGQIERLRRQYYKAIETYKTVLEIQPGMAEAVEGYQKTALKIQELQANPDSKEAKEVVEIAMADEEIQKIASDPGLAEVIKQISTNPQAAQQFLSDPTISGRIEKLINAGIIRTGH